MLCFIVQKFIFNQTSNISTRKKPHQKPRCSLQNDTLIMVKKIIPILNSHQENHSWQSIPSPLEASSSIRNRRTHSFCRHCMRFKHISPFYFPCLTQNGSSLTHKVFPYCFHSPQLWPWKWKNMRDIYFHKHVLG